MPTNKFSLIKHIALIIITAFALTAFGCDLMQENAKVFIPSDVKVLEAVSADSSATLTWELPTDGDLSHVQVYYNWTGQFHDVTKGSTKSVISGLTNGYPYKFTIFIVDDLGNKSNGKSITVIPQASVPVGNMSLGQGQLKGQVILDASSEHKGILVQVIDTNYSTYTDESGHFQLELPTGNYKGITYFKDSYIKSSYVKEFEIKDQEIYETVRITLLFDIAIKGKVIVQNREDYSSVNVEIVGTEYKTETDASGNYKLSNIPLGLYSLRFSYNPIPEAVVEVNNIEVKINQVTEVPNVLLGIQGDFKGTVTLQGLSDYAGIQISIQGTSYTTNTNIDGVFTLKDIVVGDYTITASKGGYNTYTKGSQTVIGNETVLIDTIELQDTIVPTISDTYTDIWHNTDQTIDMIAYDQGSGIKELSYTVNQVPYQVPNNASVTITDEGITTIQYSALDNLDNISAIKTLQVKIDKSIEILSAIEDTQGEFKLPNDIIRFSVNTGETSGNVKVNIGSYVTDIQLEDLENGLYEADYIIPQGLHIDNSTITAYFTDKANNTTSLENFTSSINIVNYKSSEDYASTPIGSELILENNVWGIYAPGINYTKEYSQLIATAHENSFPCYWEWNWPEEGTYVKAYPELVYGNKPWNAYNTTPKLPEKIQDILTLAVAYQAECTGTGKYNLAFDLWLTNVGGDVGSDDVTKEIMIWMNNDLSMVPAGSEMGEVQIDNDNYILYIDDTMDNMDWTYIALIKIPPNGDYGHGYNETVDFKAILTWLVENNHISNEEYLASIEFGNEIVHGQGRTKINSFVVTQD